MDSIKVPSQLSFQGSDGKRPDGVTSIPWSHGKSLTWNVTCPNPLVPSHLSSARWRVQEVERRKCDKYSSLTDHYLFVPIAVETHDSFGPSAQFIKELGRRLIGITRDSLVSFNALVLLFRRVMLCPLWNLLDICLFLINLLLCLFKSTIVLFINFYYCYYFHDSHKEIKINFTIII